MFLDLDNFKNVNDSLGHDAGDRLLQAAAQRLVKSTRPSDTVARLGGDEFAILLEGISESADVERIAATITRSFDEPLQLDGSDTYMAASIGIAFSQPGDDTEQLLRNADIAMYNAKAAGKARFVVFQPRMQEQLRERLRLEEDITRALERGEFFLEYQPVIDLAKRELLGVEALVRWNHPEQGLVMPGAFIAAAEESGQIIELGRWVLTEACRAVKAWRDTIAAGDGLRVAINVSGRHLQHADLVADVRAALDASGLEPENLVIELTESTIMHNTEVNLERFRELKSLGVRLAIDDFGMGYSSLSYLHRFPIDILKIDRSFVGRLTEQDDGPELARAVVMLGETLGLETVAEGVEHEEQVAKLLELGCVAAQGFLFARSAPLKDVAAMSFATRRAELRNAQALGDRLTATGRFNVGTVKTRSVAWDAGAPRLRAPRQATSPPITVITAAERGISASGTSIQSAENTLKSASLPASMRAALLLLERGIGRVPRQDRERLLARQALVEPPVGAREALERAARDGRIELDARVARLDRRIRAAGDHRARIEELAPGVGAADALGPEPRRREQHVADGVRGLHRGDDAELREARDVGVRDDLGVLDAEARIGDGTLGGRHRGESLLVLVERDAVAAVADGVGLDLDAAPQARDRDAQDLLGRRHVEAAVARRIAVGRIERRAAAAERAVHVELDRAHREPRVAAPVIAAGREQLLGVRGRAADRDVDAKLDAAGGVEPAELLDFAQGRAGLLQFRPAEPHVVRGARLEGARELLVRRRRHVAVDEVHRVVDQHAGRLAVPGRAGSARPAGRASRA